VAESTFSGGWKKSIGDKKARSADPVSSLKSPTLVRLPDERLREKEGTILARLYQPNEYGKIGGRRVRVPIYERGDYVKVEFESDAGLPSEWMWVRVESWDDDKKLVFGTLDNEPVNDYDDKIELGSEIAVAYSQIREHRKPTEFTKQ
jgi:hypothetical protein